MSSNYKYYLANGECIEYSLSPGSSLMQVIENIVAAHFDATHNYVPEIVWVQPKIVSLLNKEVSLEMRFRIGNLSDPSFGVFKLQTIFGPVTIVAKADLEIPIFFGTEQELEDNSFNGCMEKILAD